MPDGLLNVLKLPGMTSHDLVDQVMKPPYRCVPYVHRRTLAHRLYAAQHLDGLRVVFLFGRLRVATRTFIFRHLPLLPRNECPLSCYRPPLP